MKVEWVENTPRKIQTFAGADNPQVTDDMEDRLTAKDVDHIAEIFQTPLTGRMIVSRSFMTWASN